MNKKMMNSKLCKVDNIIKMKKQEINIISTFKFSRGKTKLMRAKQPL
jgi:hypothetical protein